MKKCYNFKSRGWSALVVLFIALFLIPDFVYSVPKSVWGFVHNSDNSVPNNNDIQITAYLSKNPGNTTTVFNISNGWTVDVDATWTWFSGGGGGASNANIGDEITLEFLNVSGGAFAGETSTLKAFLDINNPQQIGANDFSLPVELSSFNAQYKNEAVVLNWVTESELDNMGFNIYRSMEKTGNYGKINAVMVRGAGTTSVKTRYSFTDKNVNPGHTYYYKLETVDIKGKTSTFSPVSVTTVVAALPAQHELVQNFPNPFNPETTISYTLVQETPVQLTIFNMLGDYITRLVNEQQGAGAFTITWNGRNDRGQQVSAGIYFCELRTNESVLTRKMIFAK